MNTELPSSSASSPAAKIIELRALLAAKYPETMARPGAPWQTGIPSLDAALAGGLWKGGMVELVGERPSSGASALVRGMVGEAAAHGVWAGLIDGVDSFDPQTLEPRHLARLLWVRCHTAAEALQSADLLLRDGNLPLVFLDLRGNSPQELRKVASQHWYRLQRILEPTAVAFLALTPFPMVPCADARLLVQGRFSLEALSAEQETLFPQLHFQALRQRRPVTREEALAKAG